MKKIFQNPATLVTILVVIVLAVICMVYIDFDKGVGASTSPNGLSVGQATVNASSTPNVIRPSQTIGNGTFAVTYFTDQYTVAQFNQALPPDYANTYSGIKFTEFTASDAQEGISFLTMNESQTDLTSKLDQSLVSNTPVDGQNVVIYKATNSSNGGTDYYYIPLAGNKTLVISRIYGADGAPSNTDFDNLVQTLALK
jgi:hypothetical protein